MRRVSAILFLSVLILTTTQFYQLGKLPALILHYYEHSETMDISITAFLWMHYGKQTNYEKDWQRDHQLPFKHFTDQSSITIVAPSTPVTYTGIKEIQLGNPPYALPPATLLPLLSCSDIWEPPRA